MTQLTPDRLVCVLHLHVKGVFISGGHYRLQQDADDLCLDLTVTLQKPRLKSTTKYCKHKDMQGGGPLVHPPLSALDSHLCNADRQIPEAANGFARRNEV